MFIEPPWVFGPRAVFLIPTIDRCVASVYVNSMSYERIQTIVTDDQRARLQQVAAYRHVSMAAVIREAIDLYLKKLQKSKP